jgi:hypothetical protein
VTFFINTIVGALGDHLNLNFATDNIVRIYGHFYTISTAFLHHFYKMAPKKTPKKTPKKDVKGGKGKSKDQDQGKSKDQPKVKGKIKFTTAASRTMARTTRRGRLAAAAVASPPPPPSSAADQHPAIIADLQVDPEGDQSDHGSHISRVSSPTSPKSPSSPELTQEVDATSSQTPSSQATSSQPKKSAPRRQLSEDKLLLTTKQEISLVEFFESHPGFWDKEDEGFKRKVKKERRLEELASDMDLITGQI